jgi:outer membrane lipoprotein-sorting protein
MFSHTLLRRHRSGLLALVLSLLIGGAPAAAQSVDSVVENLRATYQQQLETVDTYVVETNLYTSYSRKVTRDGNSTYESSTRLKGSGNTPFATGTTPTATYGLHLDRLAQHATYAGTETINGVRCHILEVDDPEAVNPEMAAGDADQMTYYIDAERHVPARIRFTPSKRGQGPQPSAVTINMRDYRTTDGLTLPYRMEFQIDMDMSDKQRAQMEQALKQMENMPEQQRQQMQKMMGGQMDMMRQMMSGEPIVVEVQRVEVNTELPDGVF